MDDKINYVRGPDGQTVVIVPLKLTDLDEKVAPNRICLVFAIVFMILAAALLLIGFIFWIVSLFARYSPEVQARNAYIILGTGFIVSCLPIPCLCFVYQRHKGQVERYMHSDAQRRNQQGNSPEDVSNREPYQRRMPIGTPRQTNLNVPPEDGSHRDPFQRHMFRETPRQSNSNSPTEDVNHREPNQKYMVREIPRESNPNLLPDDVYHRNASPMDFPLGSRMRHGSWGPDSRTPVGIQMTPYPLVSHEDTSRTLQTDL